MFLLRVGMSERITDYDESSFSVFSISTADPLVSNVAFIFPSIWIF